MPFLVPTDSVEPLTAPLPDGHTRICLAHRGFDVPRVQLIGIVVLGEYLGLTYIEAKGVLSTSSGGMSTAYPVTNDSCTGQLVGAI
jgi:hypothetical protein